MKKERRYGKMTTRVLAMLLSMSSMAQEPVLVHTDYGSEYVKSRFQLGVTHATDAINSWGGDPAAISRMMHYLEYAPVTLQNTHIMGWGAGNPNPEPGVYDWSSLDYRIARMQENGNAEVVITFCTAPGWMKTSGEDWEMNDRVADGHFDDYARLCSQVATRYPEVKYFQVWNEFKGFWNSALNNWDVIKYTEFYNTVYDSVRAARPDAIIGGFYKGFSDEMANGGALTANDLYMIDYWLDHNVGADFIAFDGSIHGWPHVAAPEATLMELSSCFGKVAAKIREKTDLPIWVSEYYAANMVGDARFQAANHASAYYHSLINSTSVGLHWDPFGFSPLFTNPSTATGAQPTIHYDVTRYFNRHFGPGRQLYRTTNSDSLYLEVLSSATKTLLINKRPGPVTVELDGLPLELDGYEVKLVERSETLDLLKGDTMPIWPSIYPFDPADTTLQWSPGNSEVASVDEQGMITAHGQGTVDIQVTREEAGFTDGITVTVNVIHAIPVTVRVDISKVEIPPWFNTMYLADKEISEWEFVAMEQDPENEFVYFHRDTLTEGALIRPTFAFANSWGTAENPPTCAQEGGSSRTQVVSAGNHDFNFFWDEYDCTDALDPGVLYPDPEARLQFSLHHPLGTVPREILGQQLVYNHEADSLWSGPDAYLLNEEGTLSTGILRYPGGVVTNYFHWNNPTGTYTDDNWDPGYNPDKDMDTEYWMSVDEYLDVCAGLGITPLLGVNIESGLVYNREQDGIDEAVALAAYAKTRGFEGAYYYLGNEPYVQDKNGVQFSAEEYANHVVAYGSAIRAEDPGARLIIGWHRYIAEETEELEDIFRIAGDYIDIVDVHWYWNTAQSSFELWRNQQGMTTSAQAYTGGTYEEDAIAFKELTAEWGYPDVKLATLEYNAGAGNTYTGPTEFEISLMVGEMLLQYMNGGVDLACLWPTHFPFMYYAEHYNARTLFDHSRALEKNAMYDLFHFMKGVTGKRLLGSHPGNDWVYSVALQDTVSGEVDLYLLNRADTVISAVLPLNPGFQEPDIISQAHVIHYVDGPEYRADTMAGSFADKDGQTAVDLPPFSISRIRVPGDEELLEKTYYRMNITVLDQGTGAPLSGCEVHFGDHSRITDPAGKTALDSVEYGSYCCTLSAPGYDPGCFKRIEVWSDTALQFSLEKDTTPLSVTVQVHDRATGNPVNRASFMYQGLVGASDPDGEIQLQDPVPGLLVFSVEHGDFFTLVDSVEIHGDTSFVVLLTRKLASIHFEVSDKAGPLNHAAIQVNDFTVYTDASGLAWLSSQPARREYIYSIEESGYLPVNDTFFLEIDTTIAIQLESVTGLADHPLEWLVIFPNPASEKIRVNTPVKVIIRVAGLEGRILLQEVLEGPSGEIDVSGLREGCYILQVSHGQFSKFTRIMIIR